MRSNSVSPDPLTSACDDGRAGGSALSDAAVDGSAAASGPVGASRSG